MVWVKLNIGGVLYQTTSETLTSRGECFFTGLLSGKIPSTKDAQGAFLIDRNGRLFEPILEYLRTGILDVHVMTDLDGVRRECDFYQIEIGKESDGLESNSSPEKYEYFIIYLDKEFCWRGNPEGFFVSYPSHLYEYFRTFCKDGFVTFSDVSNLITALSKAGFEQDTCTNRLWSFRRLAKLSHVSAEEEEKWRNTQRDSLRDLEALAAASASGGEERFVRSPSLRAMFSFARSRAPDS